MPKELGHLLLSRLSRSSREWPPRLRPSPGQVWSTWFPFSRRALWWARVRTTRVWVVSLLPSRLSRRNVVARLVPFRVVSPMVPVVLVVPRWVAWEMWCVVLTVLLVWVCTVEVVLWGDSPLQSLWVLVVVSPNRRWSLLTPRLTLSVAALRTLATVLSIVRTSLVIPLRVLSLWVRLEVVTVAVIVLVVHIVQSRYTSIKFVSGGTRPISVVRAGRTIPITITVFMFYTSENLR